MQEVQKHEIEKNEVERYLDSGSQTQITPEIKEIASKLHGTVLERVQQILDMGPSLVTYKEHDEREFRKRTGAQIIGDKYITGCTDAALAFIVLARASNIPTKYVETIDKKFLREGGEYFSGHVYAQVYDDLKDQWVLINPMEREINVSFPESRVLYKEGLDSWDIGIKDFEILEIQEI